MPLNIKMTRAWAEIDLSAIRQNFNLAAESVAPYGTKIMAVVKTDAYGHGAVPVATELERYCGADYFAVATFPEAVELAEAGIKSPILILSEIHPSLYTELVKYKNIIPSLFHPEDAKALSDAATTEGVTADFFFVVDTGMARIGALSISSDMISDTADAISEILLLPAISAKGIFTHYACADESDKTSALNQEKLFSELLSTLEERGIRPQIASICNTAAIIESAFEKKYDLPRLGIGLYGYNPSDSVARALNFKPAMALRARITEIKDLEPGVGISYGHTFVTERKTRVATIPVGYGDGYPRLLSNKASVLIDDKEAPILGRVCMDQMMVDVTDIPSAVVGSVATLMGADKRVRADTLAARMGTISYELICGISGRIPRIYTNAYNSINDG